MNNLMQLLSYVLPIIASLSVLIVVGINLYLKIRRNYPVQVTCWFCNERTKVHYDYQNSFDCPTCLQYNGFLRNGDYNKIIPAQHDELLNNCRSHAHKNNETKNTNGLCRVCNNNQQLKIYQLANFIPLNEDNFDVEIEVFRHHLEKAYKLCPICEHIVKKTITKQNKWLLRLKLAHVKTSGLSLIDLKNSLNGITNESKRTFFLPFLNGSIIIFAIIVIINSLYNIGFTKDSLNKVFPTYFLPYILFLKDVSVSVTLYFKYLGAMFGNSYYFKSLQDIYVNSSLVNILSNEIIESGQFVNLTKRLQENIPGYLIPKRLDVSYICVFGLLLQIVASNLIVKKTSIKRLQISCWLLLIITLCIPHNIKFSLFVNFMKIIISILIVHTTFLKSQVLEQKISSPTSRRKSSKRNKADTSKTHKSLESSFDNGDSIFNSTFNIDTADSDCSLNESITSATTKTNYLSNISCNKTNHIFGQTAIFGNILSKSPTSFKELSTTTNNAHDSFGTANSFKSTYRDNSFASALGRNFDLNKSLDNLHLSVFDSGQVRHQLRKEPVYLVNKDVTRPRPILSPPKLKTVNQNSWTAGGFWKNPQTHNVFANTNISRSSSQSSGFVSQFNEPLHVDVNRFISLPPSRNNSANEGHERSSIISEPTYSLSPRQHFYDNNFSTHSYNDNSTKANNPYLFFKYARPHSVNNYSSVSPNYDTFNSGFVNFTTPINNHTISEGVHPIRAQQSLNGSLVDFCHKPTFSISGNVSSYSNTNNIDPYPNISDTFCDVNIKNDSTYKNRSLFKPLNQTLYR